MENVTTQEAYENLCNAIVLRAFEDVVNGDIGLYRYSREPPDTLQGKYRVHCLRKNAEEAKSFLMSKRLSDYTNVSGDFILKEAEKKIKYGKECIDLEFMYKEYEKGIYYEEN